MRAARALVHVAVLDGEITAGIHDGFVPVVKADQIGRRSTLAADFEYYPVPICGPHVPAVNNDPVALCCLHGNHLQP
jgi:hypothetical protein